MGTSFAFSQFIIARIVLGLGTGGIIATTSVWQAELSKAESRGSHVSGFGISCGIGLALALWVDFGTSYVSNSFSWRFPFLFPILLSLIVNLTIFTLPESPRWLVKKNRLIEARDIFSRIHNANLEADIVNREIRDVQVSLELSQKRLPIRHAQNGPPTNLPPRRPRRRNPNVPANERHQLNHLLRLHHLRSRPRLPHENSRNPRRLLPVRHHHRQRRLQLHRRPLRPPPAHALQRKRDGNLHGRPDRSSLPTEQRSRDQNGSVVPVPLLLRLRHRLPRRALPVRIRGGARAHPRRGLRDQHGRLVALQLPRR